METFSTFFKKFFMRLITFLLACIISIFSFAQSNLKIVEKTKNMQKFEHILRRNRGGDCGGIFLDTLACFVINFFPCQTT